MDDRAAKEILRELQRQTSLLNNMLSYLRRIR